MLGKDLNEAAANLRKNKNYHFHVGYARNFGQLRYMVSRTFLFLVFFLVPPDSWLFFKI